MSDDAIKGAVITLAVLAALVVGIRLAGLAPRGPEPRVPDACPCPCHDDGDGHRPPVPHLPDSGTVGEVPA